MTVRATTLSHWFLFVGLGCRLVFGSQYPTLDLQFKIVALISIFFTATYVSWLFYNRQTGFLLLQFWIFNSIFFVLVPIAVVTNQSFWPVNSGLSQDAKVLAFYVSMAILFISFIGSQSHVHISQFVKRRYIVSLERFGVILLLYVFTFLYLLFFDEEIISNALRDYGSNIELTIVSPLQSGLSKAFFVALPMIFVLVLLRIANMWTAFGRNFLLLVFLSILLVFANPLGNSRQTFLLAFLPISLAAFNKSFLFHRLVAFSIVIITIFGQPISYAISHSAEVIRYSGISSLFKNSSFRPEEILVKGDFDSFGMFANGINYLGLEWFSFPFSQLVGVLFFFIPRSFWQGKPRDTSIEIANLAGFDFQNLSAPWLLELLANGGIILVISGAFLIPRALKRIDETSKYDDFHWFLYYLLIGSELILLRGSLLQAAGVVIFGVVVSRLLVRRIG